MRDICGGIGLLCMCSGELGLRQLDAGDLPRLRCRAGDGRLDARGFVALQDSRGRCPHMMRADPLEGNLCWL
jgi:hypothetical protein